MLKVDILAYALFQLVYTKTKLKWLIMLNLQNNLLQQIRDLT